ncbi:MULTISPECIES: PaaI family thioesterase [Lactobacillaceae]|uniref:PaaI family thioesterase n=1 Tax=Lactobacillaceae TaxID=33958 RepID=UPI000C1B6ADF|nr:MULTISPECIES: PaaI family thioesterase [Lactobacillaceae]
MNILQNLGIEVISQSKKEVILEIKISDKHLQPYGIMHGGMNTILAETAASIGANLNMEDGFVGVGVDVNTHHLQPVKSGILQTVASPIRIGNNTQVWQVITHKKNSTENTSFSTITIQKIKR